jgi:carbonic anhydrase
MEHLTVIEKLIGDHRTLIITCMECCLDIEQKARGQVFRYTALGNMVNPRDEYQTQSILSFIEFKGCTRIIVAGHHDCRALNYILNREPAEDTRIFNYRNELAQLLSRDHKLLLTSPLRDRVLVEQNVIHQCEQLLGYRLIKDRFSNGELSVIGMVIERSGLCKQVFSNGISYNNLVLMN